MNETRSKNQSKIINIAFIAMMTAILCILAPIAIPLPGLVPLSLATFAIYLIAFLLEWRQTAVSTLLYLILGMIGLPLFSSYQAGIGVLLGPTGGYLIGYIPMAVLCSLIFHRTDRRMVQIAGASLATLVLYAVGTLWLMHITGMPLAGALAAGVLPFLPGDLLKIVAAVFMGPVIRQRLAAAGLVI